MARRVPTSGNLAARLEGIAGLEARRTRLPLYLMALLGQQAGILQTSGVKEASDAQ